MAKPEDYRLLIERAWVDLHHSRLQEWTALGVVIGAHLGLIQLVKLASDSSVPVGTATLVVLAALLAAIFSILGSLITCRHRHLMKVKLRWIYQAEDHLGLIKTTENPKGVIPEDEEMTNPIEWRRLALPRFLSTSGLIFLFYFVLFIVDIIVVSWCALQESHSA